MPMVLVFVLIWVKMFYDALSIYSISLDVGSPEPSWQWPGSSGRGGPQISWILFLDLVDAQKILKSCFGAKIDERFT